MTLTIKNPITAIKARRAQERHDAMIAAGKAKLAETTLVPGYVNIWC